MLILDSWKKNDGTAIYCKEIGDVNLSKAKKVRIKNKEYDIIGYDIMTSLTGIKCAMLLLNTDDIITFPQEAVAVQ